MPITDKIPQEKRALLEDALADPSDIDSQTVIRKATERGWYSPEATPLITPVKEAIGRGVEEGASLGLAKHGRAFAGGLYEALHPEVEQTRLPFIERLQRGLLSESGKEERRIKEIKKDRPVAFNISRAVSGLVPALPALVTTAAVPVLATGAATGGVEALSEGGDITKGAALGAGGGFLGLKAGEALSKLAGPLKESASELVLRSLKLAPTTMRRLRTKGNVLGKAKDLADEMVKAGVADNPVTLRKMYDKSASLLKETGGTLKDLYKEADKVVGPSGFSIDDIENVISEAVLKSRKFGSAAEARQFASDSVAGLREKVGDLGLAEMISGKAKKALSPSETWEFIKYMDDLSRQWEKASDPIFASRADDLASSADMLRGALIGKISSVSPELTEQIGKISKLYRNLATTEGALSDQVIRSMSQNRSIPRATFTEVIADLLPGTPGRLGSAKALRAAAKITEKAGRIGAPLGILGALQAERNK